jgi:hypothetical protein
VTLGLVVFVIWVAILGLQLAAMLYALNGKRLPVPAISQLTDRLTGQ